MLKSFAFRPADAGASAELFNARPIGSALSSDVMSWFAASRRARTTPDRPRTRRHALTLIVRRRSLRNCFASAVETGCVCLHALSSFQRTHDPRSRPDVDRPDRRPFPLRQSRRPSKGEPSKTTCPSCACQHLSCQFFDRLTAHPERSRSPEEGDAKRTLAETSTTSERHPTRRRLPDQSGVAAPSHGRPVRLRGLLSF